MLDPERNVLMNYIQMKILLSNNQVTQYWKRNKEKEIEEMIQQRQSQIFLQIVIFPLDMLHCRSRSVIPIFSALENMAIYNDMDDFFHFGHLHEGLAQH